MADEPGYTSVAYITDHLGSVRVVVGADGTVIKHNEFLPYGELFNNNGPYLQIMTIFTEERSYRRGLE